MRDDAETPFFACSLMTEFMANRCFRQLRVSDANRR